MCLTVSLTDIYYYHIIEEERVSAVASNCVPIAAARISRVFLAMELVTLLLPLTEPGQTHPVVCVEVHIHLAGLG